MQFNIYIVDYTGESKIWIKNYLNTNVHILHVYFINVNYKQLFNKANYDYILIFSSEEQQKKLNKLNINNNKIIFANESTSWCNNPAAIYELLNPTKANELYKYVALFNHRKYHHYLTASVNNKLHYIGTSADDFVIKYMYVTNKNHTEEELYKFYNLTKKYYPDNNQANIFLEIGANIGSAGIFFCKEIDPSLSYIAFEPDSENFKLLKINTILNDLDNIILENKGCGNKNETLTMYKNLNNPGGNGLFNFLLEDEKNFPTESIDIITLDSFFKDKSSLAKNIKYMWIDAEGNEAQVLLGASNLLINNNKPI